MKAFLKNKNINIEMNILQSHFIYIFLLLFTIKGFNQSVFENNYSDSIDTKRLNTVIMTEVTTYSVELSFLSFIWYKDHERVPFHFYNDLKGYFQMDKAGHAYGTYHQSYRGYYGLRWAGLDKKRALIFGAPVGFVFLIPIEIFDGLYEGWGFSWWDIVANAAGSSLFAVQEAILDEQIVMMKFSYSPSGYPKYHDILGKNELESFFLDYNGHTYWLSGNLNRLTGIEKIPRWINVALGYSGNGMIKEFENPEFYRGQPFPKLDRYRQWLFSLDIDFSKIPTKRKWVRSVFSYLNMIKIPFPALEVNRIDGLKFNALYF